VRILAGKDRHSRRSLPCPLEAASDESEGSRMVWTKIEKLLSHISAGLFALASVIGFIQVFFRYVLNASLFWSEEMIRYMFIWMFFLAAVEAVREQLHVRMDFFLANLKGLYRRLADILINGICALCLAGLTYYGFIVALSNKGRLTPALQLPFIYFYLAIPVGSALMLISYLVEIFTSVRSRRT
jgi:C4-dicarboxylate transporter DctQ subunit